MKCKKCDRCGCAYVGNATKNIELVYRVDKGGYSCHFYDLCDECRVDLNKWFTEKTIASCDIDML